MSVMTPTVEHNRQQESIEAKTRWFSSLSMAERMEIFCSFTDLALSVNPSLSVRNQSHAKPITGRIQILSAT
jgi:hypothetical protein